MRIYNMYHITLRKHNVVVINMDSLD